jgi:hypothetical protein
MVAELLESIDEVRKDMIKYCDPVDRPPWCGMEEALEVRGVSRETPDDLEITLHVNRPLTNEEMLALQEAIEMGIGEFGLQ